MCETKDKEHDQLTDKGCISKEDIARFDSNVQSAIIHRTKLEFPIFKENTKLKVFNLVINYSIPHKELIGIAKHVGMYMLGCNISDSTKCEIVKMSFAHLYDVILEQHRTLRTIRIGHIIETSEQTLNDMFDHVPKDSVFICNSQIGSILMGTKKFTIDTENIQKNDSGSIYYAGNYDNNIGVYIDPSFAWESERVFWFPRDIMSYQISRKKESYKLSDKNSHNFSPVDVNVIIDSSKPIGWAEVRLENYKTN